MRIEDIELVHLDQELVKRRGGFRDFVRMAWPHVEPGTTFIPNWHVDCVADHLEAVFYREINRLAINQPPGTMKSILGSVLWPAYCWTQAPESKVIAASFSDRVVERDALRSRQLMETPWYQARWGHKWQPNKKRWNIKEFRNNRAGFRFSVTVAGSVTGEHAHYQLVDDPIKPLDASLGKVDTKKLQAVIEWWDGTMSSRLTHPLNPRVIMMQRLHPKDLCGHVLKDNAYEHLMIPMRYEPKRAFFINATKAKDPRTKEGELLWTKRFDEEALKVRERELGASVPGQEQQRPAPAEGNVVNPKWWQRYKVLPPNLTDWIVSCDLSGKETEAGSYTVLQVWARRNADYFLVDQFRKRCDFTVQVEALMNLCTRYPQIKTKLVEDKSNGTPLITTLKRHVSGVQQWPPKGEAKGDKYACLNAVAYMIKSGNVFIPDDTTSVWSEEYVIEHTNFPNHDADDQVDATSQALGFYKRNERRTGRLSLSGVGLNKDNTWGIAA